MSEKISSNTIVTLAGVGVGLYIVYQIVQAIKQPLGAGADVAKAIANGTQNAATWAIGKPLGYVIGTIYAWLALPENANVTGRYVLPDMTTLNPNSVQSYWSGSRLLFNYRGQTYQLQPHDARGNYPAVIA